MIGRYDSRLPLWSINLVIIIVKRKRLLGYQHHHCNDVKTCLILGSSDETLLSRAYHLNDDNMTFIQIAFIRIVLLHLPDCHHHHHRGYHYPLGKCSVASIIVFEPWSQCCGQSRLYTAEHHYDCL